MHRLYLLACAVVVAHCPCAAFAAEYGLYFGGSGTLEVSAPKFPDAAKQVTVECRFKVCAPPTQPLKLVSQWSDDPKAEDGGLFHLTLSPASQLSFTLASSAGAAETVAGKTKVDLNRWHHVAATWDGAELAILLDGKSIGSKKPARFERPRNSALPLTVGPPPAKNAHTPSVFKGFIANVAVWSTARSIDSLKERDRFIGHEPGLLLYLPLSDTTQPTAVADRVSGNEAKLSSELARTGWFPTVPWHESPEGPLPIPFVIYDLHDAERRPRSVTEGALGVGRRILLSNEKTKQVGVISQDPASGAIFITWIDPSFAGHETIQLKSMDDGILVAGATDPLGNLYYIEIEKVPANRDEATPLKAVFRGTSADGKALGEKLLDMSNSKGGFDVWNYDGPWHGSLTYHNGALGLILPRLMYKGEDGIHHQSAIAVVFSAKDPSVYKHLGRTSGHSFGNVLSVNSRGEFLGVDLGDCYPRGVNLHKFTTAGIKSRVVFTYKTAHSVVPSKDSPIYAEISGNGKTFYKWSNDNNTYTELGGVVEGRLSYSVIFSTERSLEGRVLDNSRAFQENDDPRDLAMLRIIKDFEKVSGGGSAVSDALLAGLPAGAQVESGGFYDFAGKWSAQRTTGVIWLTKYGKDEAAHAPQRLITAKSRQKSPSSRSVGALFEVAIVRDLCEGRAFLWEIPSIAI